MPYCPECRSEYREGFETCSQCAVPLVASLPEMAPDSSDELAELAESGEAAVVARAPYDEACRMQESLQERSVAALVVADPESRRHGAFLQYFVAVRPGDLDLARRCLHAEFQALIEREGLAGPASDVVDHDAGGPITCPACGATFPPANECPECGLFVGAPAEE